MSKNKLLESAVIALLNKEGDRAEELFHEYIVSTARNIHESHRVGDLALEGFEDDADADDSDHYFTEADLDDAEGDVEGDAADDLADDMGAEDDASDLDADFDGDVDATADLGDVEDTEETSIEDLADDLASMQDELNRLIADFEAEMASDDADVADADVADEADVADLDVADDAGIEGDDFADETDEFDDITEGVLDELIKASAIECDGVELGGGKIAGNTKSLPPVKGEAHPIKSKQSMHKGFDRETAPETKPLGTGRNVLKSKVEDEMKTVEPKTKTTDHVEV